MLAAVIFLGLLFVLVCVGVWYYYRWTPEGILKDVESNYDSSMLLKDAAERAQYVEAAQKDVAEQMAVTSQNFNPVKNYRRPQTELHPECAEVPEVCPVCLDTTLDANGECPDVFCGRDK